MAGAQDYQVVPVQLADELDELGVGECYIVTSESFAEAADRFRLILLDSFEKKPARELGQILKIPDASNSLALRLPVLVVIISLCILGLTNPPRTSSAIAIESSSATAWTDIVQAFQTIQLAEADGVARDKIVPLSNELNVALADYGNATLYGASNSTSLEDHYSTLSINASTDVFNKASSLDAAAKSEQITSLEIDYGMAAGLAVISAILIVERNTIRAVISFRGKRKTVSTPSSKHR